MSYYKMVGGRMRRQVLPSYEELIQEATKKEDKIKEDQSVPVIVEHKQKVENIKKPNISLSEKLMSIKVKPRTEGKGQERTKDELFESVNNVSMERLKKFANLKV